MNQTKNIHRFAFFSMTLGCAAAITGCAAPEDPEATTDAMSISVTPKAAVQIRKALAKRGGGVGLRVAIKTSGCSGYAYALEFADEAAADDLSFESEGVQLLVEARSLPMIAGTQLDWVREGLNEGFKFNNPNASATCGCGESFAV